MAEVKDHREWEPVDLQWLKQRDDAPFATVGRHVPRIFDRYARVLHSAEKDGLPSTWQEAARLAGLPVRGDTQWSSIQPSQETGINRPIVGNVDRKLLKALVGILEMTSAVRECVLAYWVGFGTLDVATGMGAQPDRDSTNLGSLAHRSSLQGREYAFIQGDLKVAQKFTQSPNLVWPLDQSWLLATEIDFDSTLLGGASPLIDALLADPSIEAWEVSPETYLGGGN